MPQNNKRSGLRLRLQIISVLSVIGLVIGQLGQLYWAFDLFSHFSWCYLIGFLLGIFAFKKILLKAMMGSLFLAILLWSSPNLLLDKSGLKITTPPVQLLTYNLKFDSFDSSHHIRAVKLMDEMTDQPVVIFLSEYSTEFDVTFKGKYQEYYQCGKPEDSPFGLALYSTLDKLECTVEHIDDTKLFPYIRAENDNIVVYGIHPPPPVNQTMANTRDYTLSVIATKVKQESKPVVVMGDMNISPYSPVFRQFLKDAGLFEMKNRLIPTWLLGMINIDHILVTHPDQRKSRLGWWRGSDHRPVFLEEAKRKKT